MTAPAIGCGDDEAGVRDILEDARAAFLAEDYRAVCGMLTPDAKHQIGSIGHTAPTTCIRDLSSRISGAYLSRRDRMEPEIEEIEVEGDRAVAIARLAGSTPTRLRLRMHRGRWKLVSIFGTSGPPLESPS